MNLQKLRIISLLAILSICGIIALQVYWITNAADISRRNFEQSVNEALRNVVYKLEKQNAAVDVGKKLKSLLPPAPIDLLPLPGEHDSIYTRYLEINQSGDDKKQKTHIKIGHVIPSETHRIKKFKKFEKTDSSLFAIDNTNEFEEISSDIKNHADTLREKIKIIVQKSAEWTGLFDEIFNTFPLTELAKKSIDSLIHTELNVQGIHLPYQYAIIPAKGELFTDSTSSQLLNSKYKVNIRPRDIFSSPVYLSIYFENEGYGVLRSVWILLLLSLLLSSILGYSLYYTISTIYRQKKLSDIKSDFINNMTHELKTPISTVSLACEALEDASITNTKEKSEKYISIIREENKRLGVLVENVLQSALIDKKEFSLHKEELDIHELILHVIKNISPQLDKKKALLHTSFHAQNSCIEGDPVHLSNVIFNLIDNALKYTETLPVITISTSDAQRNIHIEIEDNGMGINKEQMKYIFDKFYRIPSGNIHNVKGHGLGLNYVKTIVEKHGGNIHVNSEPGKGSRFIIKLPLKNDTDTNV